MDQRNDRGEQFTDPSMDLRQRTSAILANLATPLIPGTLKNLIRMDLAPSGPVAQQVGKLANFFGLGPKPMTEGRKVEYAMGVTRTVLDKKQAYQWKAREWVTTMRASVGKFTQLMQDENQHPKDELEDALLKSIEIQKMVCMEASNVTYDMMAHFGMDPDVLEDALKQATEREGRVAGGHMNEDHREAILENGGYYTKGSRLSVEIRDRIFERAAKYQPERELWFDEWEAKGWLEVQKGR